jgi:hypothetical protein
VFTLARPLDLFDTGEFGKTLFQLLQSCLGRCIIIIKLKIRPTRLASSLISSNGSASDGVVMFGTEYVVNSWTTISMVIAPESAENSGTADMRNSRKLVKYSK